MERPGPTSPYRPRQSRGVNANAPPPLEVTNETTHKSPYRTRQSRGVNANASPSVPDLSAEGTQKSPYRPRKSREPNANPPSPLEMTNDSTQKSPYRSRKSRELNASASPSAPDGATEATQKSPYRPRPSRSGKANAPTPLEVPNDSTEKSPYRPRPSRSGNAKASPSPLDVANDSTAQKSPYRSRPSRSGNAKDASSSPVERPSTGEPTPSPGDSGEAPLQLGFLATLSKSKKWTDDDLPAADARPKSAAVNTSSSHVSHASSHASQGPRPRLTRSIASTSRAPPAEAASPGTGSHKGGPTPGYVHGHTHVRKPRRLATAASVSGAGSRAEGGGEMGEDGGGGTLADIDRRGKASASVSSAGEKGGRRRGDEGGGAGRSGKLGGKGSRTLTPVSSGASTPSSSFNDNGSEAGSVRSRSTYRFAPNTPPHALASGVHPSFASNEHGILAAAAIASVGGAGGAGGAAAGREAEGKGSGKEAFKTEWEVFMRQSEGIVGLHLLEGLAPRGSKRKQNKKKVLVRKVKEETKKMDFWGEESGSEDGRGMGGVKDARRGIGVSKAEGVGWEGLKAAAETIGGGFGEESGEKEAGGAGGKARPKTPPLSSSSAPPLPLPFPRAPRVPLPRPRHQAPKAPLRLPLPLGGRAPLPPRLPQALRGRGLPLPRPPPGGKGEAPPPLPPGFKGKGPPPGGPFGGGRRALVDWGGVTNADGTIWASELDFDIDIGELKKQFEPKAAAPFKKAEQPVKKQVIRIIDMAKSRNVEISLRSMKLHPHDLVVAVLSVDTSTIGEWCDSLVETLLKYGPDDKEKRLLREFKGNVEDLGPCEQLFRALLGVQRLEPKLKVLQYRIFLAERAPELADTIKFVTLVSQKIQESQKLQHVLLVVRDIGNKLNEGTKKGKVVGFAANDLNKVANTKGFMAYLIKVLSQCRPEWLYFWKDFTDGSRNLLNEAIKVDQKGLAEVVKELDVGKVLVERELKECEKMAEEERKKEEEKEKAKEKKAQEGEKGEGEKEESKEVDGKEGEGEKGDGGKSGEGEKGEEKTEEKKEEKKEEEKKEEKEKEKEKEKKEEEKREEEALPLKHADTYRAMQLFYDEDVVRWHGNVHSLMGDMNASAENLARKFGSDPKTTSFTLIFGVLRDFVDLLKKNLVEYEKKKKAEEEAAKEKAQPKAKASGKHNHSPSLFCLPHYPSSHLPPVFSVLRDFVDLFKKNLVEYEKKKKADEEATKDFADQFPVSISFSWALVDEQDELGGGLHGRCWQGRSRGGEHRWMRMKTVRMMTGVIRGGGVWAAGMTTGVAMEMGAGGSAGAGRGDHEESSCGQHRYAHPSVVAGRALSQHSIPRTHLHLLPQGTPPHCTQPLHTPPSGGPSGAPPGLTAAAARAAAARLPELPYPQCLGVHAWIAVRVVGLVGWRVLHRLLRSALCTDRAGLTSRGGQRQEHLWFLHCVNRMVPLGPPCAVPTAPPLRLSAWSPKRRPLRASICSWRLRYCHTFFSHIQFSGVIASP
ncbi:unnamed protein product, partial [Closterium sp. NIES-64]